MSAEHNSDEQTNLHYEGGVPILGPPPKDEEAEKRANTNYQRQQLALQRGMLLTQVGLVLFGLITGGVSVWQASISQTSAEAARSAAQTATDSLITQQSQFDRTMVQIVDQTSIQSRSMRATEKAARAAEAANRIADDAVRPILEITDLGGYASVDRYGNSNGSLDFFVTADSTSFQFFVENKGPGDAKNIRYAISRPYAVDLSHNFSWTEHEIGNLVSQGKTLGENPLTGSIGELDGNTKTVNATPIIAKSIYPPHELLTQEIGEWFYGELYWDDPYGETHTWKRIFCFLVTMRNDGSATIRPCGIPQERVEPEDSRHKN